MTEQPNNRMMAQTVFLLNRYGFEMRGQTALELMEQWRKDHPIWWIRLAVLESLYLGRYKAISVEHILDFWLRKGQPNFHFTHEFEGLICRDLPYDLPVEPVPTPQKSRSEPEFPDLLNQWTEILKEKESHFRLTLTSPKMLLEASELLSPEELPSDVPVPYFSKRAINQFTPLLARSEFYSKLRAVVHQQVKENKMIE